MEYYRDVYMLYIMTLSDLEIFNDTKQCAASLQQLSFLYHIIQTIG